MLEIQSNGSKWHGEQPDSIETLLEALKSDPLDPVFEKYGNFANPNPKWLKKEAQEKYKGCTTFFGNFAELSHGFRIVTDEPEIIKTLTAAIRENQKSPEYRAIREKTIIREKKEKLARKLFDQGKITLKELYAYPFMN